MIDLTRARDPRPVALGDYRVWTGVGSQFIVVSINEYHDTVGIVYLNRPHDVRWWLPEMIVNESDLISQGCDA